MTLADTTAGAFGTDDFTLEFWIYNIGNANFLNAVLGTYNGNNAATHWGLQIDRDAEGNIYWYYGITLGINSSVKLNKNTWTHIAVVRNSSTTTMYVNGVSGGSFSDNTNYVSPSGLSIGTDLYNHSAYEMTGYLSNVRIVKGTALYTTNFTPPTAPVSNTNTTLYLPFDNAGIFDKTGNNRLTLFGNTATSTTQTKYTDTAMYFDGSGDYITAGDIDLNTNDFTIETWLYQVASGQYSSIFSTTINTGTANGLRISTGPSNNTFQVASVSSALLNASTSFSNNVWNHVALTRSGSTMRLFLNGVQVGSVSNSTNFASDNWIIGDVQGTGAPYNLTGYMENFQILKGVAKYTGNFTPPINTQGRTYQAET